MILESSWIGDFKTDVSIEIHRKEFLNVANNVIFSSPEENLSEKTVPSTIELNSYERVCKGQKTSQRFPPSSDEDRRRVFLRVSVSGKPVMHLRSVL